MNRRLQLHELLVNVLGSRNVYFQPPSTIKMQYPAIIYARKTMNVRYADDIKYNNNVAYTITLIDTNPDSEIVNKINDLPFCKYTQHYTADNLNHDVFELFY